jgi:hypothetical protein
MLEDAEDMSMALLMVSVARYDSSGTSAIKCEGGGGAI